MATNYEQAVPIGGVIPWVGEAYGLEVPRNYAVLADIIIATLPTESPFFGQIATLKDMEGRTFHSVTDTSKVNEELGSDILEVTLVERNLPTTYTYTENWPTYYKKYNIALDDGTVKAETGSYSVPTGHYANANLGFDGTYEGISGSGDSYLRYWGDTDTTLAEYYSGYTHKHSINTKHRHKYTPVANSSIVFNSNFTYGDWGDATPIEVNTSNSALGAGTCKFLIRLW
ncbi:hypothetical protein [Vibrio phage VCPH]|nr:hypothetical protein [Vibrio phage VCPH]